MKVPFTVIRPSSPREGDFLDALERWGELPDKLPIPDAVRYLAHLTKQNPGAIQKVVLGAMLAGELRYWGQSGRPGQEWAEGMFRSFHRHAQKPRIRLGLDGTAKELSAVLEPRGTPHLDAMAVDPREVVALLIARGRKVPDELRHLVTDGAAPTEPESDGADQHIGDWLRAELWTLCEAAYLLSGATPRDEGAFVAADRDAGGAVGKAYRALKDATLAGSLPFIEVDGVLLRRRIKPADAVAWAIAGGVAVPEVLRALAESGAKPEPQDEHSEPRVSAADASPDAAPRPLTTRNLAEAFDGIRRSANEWARLLGDTGACKWAHPARVEQGARGKRPTTWNPVTFALLLEKREEATRRALRERFRTRAELAEWRDEWARSIGALEHYFTGTDNRQP